MVTDMARVRFGGSMVGEKFDQAASAVASGATRPASAHLARVALSSCSSSASATRLAGSLALREKPASSFTVSLSTSALALWSSSGLKMDSMVVMVIPPFEIELVRPQRQNSHMKELTTEELAVAMHAHLCRLTARIEALEELVQAQLPPETVPAAKHLLETLERRYLSERVKDLDKISSGLAAAVGEMLEHWDPARPLYSEDDDS